MKKIVLVGALALLAACGSSGNGASVATSGGTSGGTSAGSDTTAAPGDTISVSDFGDMPPKCIDLLSSFLKSIEPTVSKVDWKTATLGDFESLGEAFQAQSDTFDTQSAAAGCDKYNLTGSDEEQIKQVVKLAAAEAPGTVAFLTFLGTLSSAATASGSIPADCAGLIAAMETYMDKGTTMKDLTMTELTQFGQLMQGLTTNCTVEEAQAFTDRDDVTAFFGS